MLELDELELVTQQVKGAVSVGDLVEISGGAIAVVLKLDKVAKAVTGQVIPGVTRGGIDKAADSFREFSGMEPGSVVTVPEPDSPAVAWWLGNMLAVEYETIREGKRERYRHKFKQQARPALGVTIDAHQLVILGGGYRVTDRGITDD